MKSHIVQKWIRPEDLNPHGRLFGGSLLRWIDEEAAIFAHGLLQNPNVVTKYISEINFMDSAQQADIITLILKLTHVGKSSITFSVSVTKEQDREILNIEKLVFVMLDADGKPIPHHLSI